MRKIFYTIYLPALESSLGYGMADTFDGSAT